MRSSSTLQAVGIPFISDIEDAVPGFQPNEITTLRENLVKWYTQNRRKLPWRGDVLNGYADQFVPTSSYGTWVSEVMLQQTRVETVIPYWYRWMGRFPTVAALAAATPDEVNTLWAGLGYYRRAQQLLAGAKVVMESFEGTVPDNIEDLKKVPGIGPYTAGAIASIAYGKQEALVDGNVIRVLSRLRAISTPTGPALDKLCWTMARAIVDPSNPSAFNQGLMELGATVCKPTSPSCLTCPVAELCQGKALAQSGSNTVIEDVTYFPVKADKKPPKQMSFAVCVFLLSPPPSSSDSNQEHMYLFLKRPDKGLLANQWEFPSIEIEITTSNNNVDQNVDILDGETWSRFSAYLNETFGIQCYNIDSTSLSYSSPVDMNENKSGTDHVIRLINKLDAIPPITHIFSHQVHTMYIQFYEVALQYSTAATAAGSITSDDIVHFNSNSNNNDENEKKNREYRWMTCTDIIGAGITSGCKKILSAVSSAKIENNIDIVQTSSAVKTRKRKLKCEDVTVEKTLDSWLSKK